MSDRPILYGYGASTYVRTALLALEEKAVEYDFVTVASWDGYRKNPAFADLHPFAKVPILDHCEERIFETLAICTYVDEAFDGPSLQPTDPLARARMLQIISVIISYAWPVWVPVLSTETFFSVFENKAMNHDKIKAVRPQIGRAAEVIDGLLAARPSGPLNLADIFLAGSFCYVAQTPEGAELLSRCPALSDWWQSFRTRDSARKIMPPTDWQQRLKER